MSRVVTHPPPHLPGDDRVRLGGWWHDADEAGRIVCDLCPRACHLKPGDRGFCFVRENRGGQMVLTTYGRSTGFCVDPIEKKPLNHFFPGTSVLSFGTAGCNLGCKFCQNWSISKSREVARLSEFASGETIANAAVELGCRSVAFTYNDPVIWAEYALDAAKECHQRGIKTVAVTAGYITPVARQPFFEAMDAANVDLKGFTETFYQQLTLSHLQPVLDTLAWLKRETDVWFEITNLIIPQANDSFDELQRMCDWVVKHVGGDVPVHFTAFHPDFRLRDRQRTPVETLLAAREIALQAGLNYVYVGNVDDELHQSTYCAECGKLVIQRNWYELGTYHLRGDRCGHCGARLPGVFGDAPGTWGRKRAAVRIADFCHPPRPSHLSDGGQSQMALLRSQTSTSPVTDQAPQLSSSQESAIHHAACHITAATLMGQPAELADDSLAGAHDKTVMGCFVTLKRKGRLRACCGFVGRMSPLGVALREAAETTATRDSRLPSISVTELPYLEVDVSLLHSLQRVKSNGDGRAKAVVVGRHGLHISSGERRGLLLPVVASENGWNAREFLDQVCLKANLPAGTWRDNDAQLMTFQSHGVGGAFPAHLVPEASVPQLFNRENVGHLAKLCTGNILALLAGATPTCYAPKLPDGTVQGVAIQLTMGQHEERPRFAQFSLRPGIPLQATLLEVCKLATASLDSAGFDAYNLENLTVDLAVLWDPAMHATVAEPDLDGMDSLTRALLITERGRSAWVFDPSLRPAELLKAAVDLLSIRSPHAASITSLQAITTREPMQIGTSAKPQVGPDVRSPAVAGMFYPADAGELQKTVDDLFRDDVADREPWSAAMVPHAGLVYSGRLAADVMNHIDMPDSIIVIGPKHTRLGVDWAVAPHEKWSLPGMEMASDRDMVQQLVRAIPGLELDAAAHAREHAIEVELPLLARCAPHARVVGIAIGSADLAQCQSFARGLADVLRGRRERTLLVISSDMNHFADDARTRELDALALTAMESLDPEELLRTVRSNRISMCGVLPAVIVMQTLREMRRLKRCRRVGYTTSADVTGDTSRVVGYAGMLLG